MYLLDERTFNDQEVKKDLKKMFQKNMSSLETSEGRDSVKEFFIKFSIVGGSIPLKRFFGNGEELMRKEDQRLFSLGQ